MDDRICDHDAQHVRSGDPVRENGAGAGGYVYSEERETWTLL